MGKNINRVGNDKNDSVLFHSRSFDAVEDLRKEADVTVDKIEAAFIRLAAKTGGDDEDVRVSSAIIVT